MTRKRIPKLGDNAKLSFSKGDLIEVLMILIATSAFLLFR